MNAFLGTLRFIAGMAMLVGGVAIMAPIAVDAFSDRSASAFGPVAPVAAETAMRPGGINHSIPDPRPHDSSATTNQAMTMDPAAPATGGGFPERLPYVPPLPPPPLPAAGVVREAPDLTATYRSTVAVPPPPLLDVNGPPPVAPGWSTRGQRPVSSAATSGLPAVPPTYAVRDGDDLTMLAIRFYGHAGAAAAILAANRDRLTDPAILPIGLSLRMPPPWTVGGAVAGTGPLEIQPGPGASAVMPPMSPQAARPASWLSAGQGVAHP